MSASLLYLVPTHGPGHLTTSTVEAPLQVLAGSSSKKTAPAAPSFTLSATSKSQVSVTWKAVSGATGYMVDKWVNGAWSKIGTFNSTTTHFNVSGLSAGTTYYIEVAAYNTVGATWAPYKSVTTPNSVPSAPTFTLSDDSDSQISVAWRSVSGATGYIVDEWINGAWSQIGSFGSSSTGTTVSGLNAGTTYYFDVAATNSAGTTWANWQSVTTSISVDHPSADTGYSPAYGSLFGSGGPSYLDVNQGAVGDCWLMASLAEVAARYPTDITNMFTADGTAVENGSTVSLYTVRLFDTNGNAQYIKVDTELPSGGGYYGHPANGTYWAALAEKAYAQANGLGYVSTQYTGSDSYDALDGGYPAWALQAITGKTTSAYNIDPNNIAAAWNSGQLIVLCTNSPVSQYIVPSHCYAVVGYDGSANLPFEAYNPWGTDSSGWALGTYNGQSVYGLFNANGPFISQNFAYDAQSSGTSSQADILTSSSQGFGATPNASLFADDQKHARRLSMHHLLA